MSYRDYVVKREIENKEGNKESDNKEGDNKEQKLFICQQHAKLLHVKLRTKSRVLNNYAESVSSYVM